jgi:hypothetical protein
MEKQWLCSAIKCELFLSERNAEKDKKIQIAKSFSDRCAHLGFKHDLPIMFSFRNETHVGMVQSFNGAEM